MKKLLHLIFLCLPFGITAQSNFTVTTTGTTLQIDNAIDYATDIWSQYLNSTIPIKLNVIFTNLGNAGTDGGIDGVCLANIRTNFTGSPNPSLTYLTSLANAISGMELNVGENDMDLYLNSSTNWYFGLDGNPASTQVDLVSLVIHEIGHGLGGFSFAEVENGLGSFGTFTQEDIPLPTSFPINFEPGAHTIWDDFLANDLEQHIADSSIFPNQTIELANEIQSNAIYFSGSNATTANGGVHPKIYAPSVWSLASSMHHFDEDTFPAGSGNELLTPFSDAGDVIQSPGPVLLGALKDIGWSINEELGLDKHVIQQAVSIYPNPVNDVLTVKSGEALSKVEFYSIIGQKVKEINSNFEAISTSSLSSGIYIVKALSDEGSVTKRIVKE